MAALIHPQGVCTAFLVQTKYLVTNEHCLANLPRNVGASCSALRVVFPKAQTHSEEVVPCLRILRLSPKRGDVVLAPDYAVLELKQKVNRPSLQIMRSGFEDDKTYKVWSFFYSNSRGVLQQETCRATHRSIKNPYATSARSSLFQLTSCAAVKGNSGSPVLNDQGQVVGILSAVESALTMKVPTGYGTNLACVDWPELGLRGASFETCHKIFSNEEESKLRSQMRQRILQPLVDEIKTEISKALPSLNGKLPRVFSYEINSDLETVKGFATTSVQRWRVLPTCFNRLLLKTVTRNSGELNLPSWSLKEIIDEYGHVKSEKSSTQETVFFEFSLPSAKDRVLDWKANAPPLSVTWQTKEIVSANSENSPERLDPKTKKQLDQKPVSGSSVLSLPECKNE